MLSVYFKQVFKCREKPERSSPSLHPCNKTCFFRILSYVKEKWRYWAESNVCLPALLSLLCYRPWIFPLLFSFSFSFFYGWGVVPHTSPDTRLVTMNDFLITPFVNHDAWPNDWIFCTFDVSCQIESSFVTKLATLWRDPRWYKLHDDD